MEPTAADREPNRLGMMIDDMARARKFIPRPISHGSPSDAPEVQAYSVAVALLAAEFAAVRAEHDVGALMRDERWGDGWTLWPEGKQFCVIDWHKPIGEGDLGIADTPVAACQAALATVKETP